MDAILIPLMALAVPIVIVPTSLWFRHRLKTQQMEHAERIKAMELGLTPPTPRLGWPGAAVCLGIGAGVPIGSMGVAWLAVLTNDVPSEVFGIPLLISFAAIWAAKSLAERMMGGADPRDELASKRGSVVREPTKPAFDPDAYDVVGSRG